MKIKKFAVTAFVAVALFTAGSAHAAHYVLGYSSVDEKEIRWGGSTTYSSQWNSAISTWNARGKVNIAPDTIWTYQDLTVSDVDRSDYAWTGQYTRSAGSDTLKFNKYYLKNDTNAERQNTATHELGHALGLDHSFSGNVLYAYQTTQTALGSQDKDDYGYLWGY